MGLDPCSKFPAKSHLLIVSALVSWLCFTPVSLSWSATTHTDSTFGGAGAVDKFEQAKRFRNEAEFDKALRLLRSMLEDYRSDERVLKQTYHQLVFTLLDVSDPKEAEAVAREAIGRFPRVTADVVTFPPSVNELYDRLRRQMFGSLVVETDPTRCEVSVGDVYTGPSPLKMDYLPVGGYQLRITKEGYREKTLPCRIDADRETSIDAVLETRDQFWRRGRYRFGVGLGTSYTWLSNQKGVSPGIQASEDGRASFTFGATIDIGLRARFYFQSGVRYTRLGSSEPDKQDEYYVLISPEGDIFWVLGPPKNFERGEIELDYLVFPLVFKMFPRVSRGLFVTTGLEIGFLLNAQLSGEPIIGYEIGGSETRLPIDEDLTDSLRGFNLFFSLGIGHEFRMWEHFPFVDLRFSMSLMDAGGLLGHELGGSWCTREVRLSAGFIF